MKLYTKEDFLKATEFCEVSMIDAKYIIERIDEVTDPIELPSAEEIKHYWSKSNNTPWDIAAINGALVIVDQIKQGRFLKKPKGGNK